MDASYDLVSAGQLVPRLIDLINFDKPVLGIDEGPGTTSSGAGRSQ